MFAYVNTILIYFIEIHFREVVVMDVLKLQKLLKNKDKTITIRINSDLLALLDKEVKKNGELKSRNEFVERCILKYLSKKGKLK